MGGRLDPALAATRAAVRHCLTDSALPAGSLVLVACSGGPDSLALAVATSFVAPKLGLRAGVVTVDHGLHPRSADVAADVVRTCTALQLVPVENVRVDVARTGRGPEAEARDARYTALDDVAGKHGAALVLLGHTRDDQAEQVLLGLARGSGARALSGMPAARGRYRRPLLDLPRETTEKACAAAGLIPWRDPANDDDTYTRVRVRTAALPALEQALGPGVAAALARSAAQLRADADALDALAADAVAAAADPDGGWSVPALAALPPAVRTRALRTIAGGEGSASQVTAMDALLTRWRGQGGVSLPGGGALRRVGLRVLVESRE